MDCPSGTKAVLKVYLQEYFSDRTWRTMNIGTKTVYSGGGSAHRAVGRRTCQGARPMSWRTMIDVDLVGLADSANVGITQTVTLNCVVN